MTIGIDVSHWQGVIDWQKAKAAGVQFAYVKCSQGTGYKDKTFEQNMAGAAAAGILVGAYHFVTTADAAKQAAWFIQCMGDPIAYQFDLRPALDCEAYSGASAQLIRLAILQGHPEPEVEIITELRDGTPHTLLLSELPYGYAITTEKIVDSIGRKLVSAGFDIPAIYTNPASGNKIFKLPGMSRYPLWIAHWHGKTQHLEKPTLPKVWAGKPWYIWQDEVIPGAPYGIEGQVDHDIWGELFPFPGQPQPSGPDITAVVTYDGVEYKLVREQ